MPSRDSSLDFENCLRIDSIGEKAFKVCRY